MYFQMYLTSHHRFDYESLKKKRKKKIIIRSKHIHRLIQYEKTCPVLLPARNAVPWCFVH